MATDCSIEGCEQPHEARGWCSRHYDSWRAHGDPLALKYHRYSTPEESFSARTKSSPSGCLEWTGALYGNGYGNIRVGGRSALAHRYAWERANGPIPEGAEVDHICHNVACVAVEHLRLATRVQNSRNFSGARRDNLSTGIRGVSVSKQGRIRAYVYPGGGGRIEKTFRSVEDATEWVRDMRGRLYGAFQGGG